MMLLAYRSIPKLCRGQCQRSSCAVYVFLQQTALVLLFYRQGAVMLFQRKGELMLLYEQGALRRAGIVTGRWCWCRCSCRPCGADVDCAP